MAVPVAPTNFSADPQTNSEIKLTWDHDTTWFGFKGDDSTLGGFDEGKWYAGGNDGFNIYRSTSSGSSLSDYTKVDSVGGNSFSYSDTSLTEDEEYFYRVTAYNADGESDQSNEDSALTYTYYSRTVSSYSGTLSSSVSTAINLSVNISSHTNSKTSTAIREIGIGRGVSSYSSSLSSSVQRSSISFENRTISSHLGLLDSSVEALIQLSYGVSSHATQSTSSSKRSVDLKRTEHNSYSSTIFSEANTIITISTTVNSHTEQFRSYSYNDRTSLELFDYHVTWDDEKSVWYTPWINQELVLGSEDIFVIRGSVIENAKDPTALVSIQYDSDNDGVPNGESEIVTIGNDEQVQEVHDIPIQEGGRYRIKIMEYSGYNSLYSLDMAVVHS